MQESSLKSRTVEKATQWSFLTQLVAKIISPLSSIILARVFAPEVFGIIATITMVTGFAETFSESGFQKFIISKSYMSKDELDQDADVAFWTNFGISILLLIIIGGLSTPLCNLLGNPGIEKALIVACLQLPIMSMSSIQTAVFHRLYNFKRVFYAQLVSSVVNLIVTLIFAFLNLGFWAIIIGTLSSCLLRAFVLTLKAPWYPHLYYNIRRAIGIFRFSFWIMLEGLAVWLTSWFDSFVVGNRLSDHNLGIYKNSQSVVNGILSIPQYSITNVLLVTLSKSKNDEERYQEEFLKAQRMLAYILLPMGVGIYVFRRLAVRLAFGAGWEDSELVVGVWALASVMRILFVSINTAVYVSKGKPKISLYCQFIDMVILIPFCIFGIKMGFEKFVLLRGIVRLDIIIPNFIILSKMFGIRFKSIFNNVLMPVCATLTMAIIAVLLRSISLSLIWNFIAIIICIVFYFTFIYIFSKKDLMLLKSMLKVGNKNEKIS